MAIFERIEIRGLQQRFNDLRNEIEALRQELRRCCVSRRDRQVIEAAARQIESAGFNYTIAKVCADSAVGTENLPPDVILEPAKTRVIRLNNYTGDLPGLAPDRGMEYPGNPDDVCNENERGNYEIEMLASVSKDDIVIHFAGVNGEIGIPIGAGGTFKVGQCATKIPARTLDDEDNPTEMTPGSGTMQEWQEDGDTGKWKPVGQPITVLNLSRGEAAPGNWMGTSEDGFDNDWMSVLDCDPEIPEEASTNP